MNIKMIIAIGAAAAAAVVAIKKLRNPKKRTATVQQKNWSAESRVQTYEEKTESGWSVPDGAYDVSTERRLRRVSVPRVTNIPRSIGDGADAIRDILNTTIDTYTTSEYKTWYTYKVRRWVDDRTARASGTDGEPRVDVKIDKPYSGEGDPEIGMQRVLGPTAKYNILAVDTETGEFVSFDVDEDTYKMVDVGKVVVYTRFFGRKTIKGLDVQYKPLDFDECSEDEGVAVEPVDGN